MNSDSHTYVVNGDIPYIVYLWVDLKIRRKENKSINQMLTDADRQNANFFSPTYALYTHMPNFSPLKNIINFIHTRLEFLRRKKIHTK